MCLNQSLSTISNQSAEKDLLSSESMKFLNPPMVKKKSRFSVNQNESKDFSSEWSDVSYKTMNKPDWLDLDKKRNSGDPFLNIPQKSKIYIEAVESNK